MSYHTIVKKTIQDEVPKAIMHFLVHSMRDRVFPELVSQLYHTDLKLLHEAPGYGEQRKKTRELLKALEQASSILDSVAGASSLPA